MIKKIKNPTVKTLAALYARSQHIRGEAILNECYDEEKKELLEELGRGEFSRKKVGEWVEKILYARNIIKGVSRIKDGFMLEKGELIFCDCGHKLEHVGSFALRDEHITHCVECGTKRVNGVQADNIRKESSKFVEKLLNKGEDDD